MKNSNNNRMNNKNNTNNNNLIEINSYSSHNKILVEGILKRLESFNCDFITLIK